MNIISLHVERLATTAGRHVVDFVSSWNES